MYWYIWKSFSAAKKEEKKTVKPQSVNEEKKEQKRESKKENRKEIKKEAPVKVQEKNQEAAPADKGSEEKPREERKVTLRTEEEIAQIKEDAEKFLTGVFKAMELQVTLKMEYKNEEGNLNIDFEGEDMGILIGKRGQTLDSLQYLTSLVVNKGRQGYIRGQVSDEQIIGNCRILQSVIYLICEDGISVNLIIRELAQIFCLGFFFFPALISSPLKQIVLLESL